MSRKHALRLRQEITQVLLAIGLKWFPKNDELRVSDGIVTKRKILSCFAHLYDPQLAVLVRRWSLPETFCRISGGRMSDGTNRFQQTFLISGVQSVHSSQLLKTSEYSGGCRQTTKMMFRFTLWNSNIHAIPEWPQNVGNSTDCFEVKSVSIPHLELCSVYVLRPLVCQMKETLRLQTVEKLLLKKQLVWLQK